MKKQYFFTFCILLIGVIATLASVKCEFKSRQAMANPTFMYSDEQILAGGYFDILVPAAENRNLPSDVESYSYGDGFVHIVLPSRVLANNLVFYVRDAEGNLLSRRECDFSQDVYIGNWQIVIDRPTLPVVYFESNNANDFDNMISAPDTSYLCPGKVQIYVDPKEAKERGWLSEYVSVERHDESYSAALQGRGSSSWDCESKKSFTLRLSKEMNLLGMGSNRNWNLIGNAYDPSLLKNITFNQLAERVGIKYQPHMQCVNLYVDGKYQGVYLLTTKLSVAKNRIALSKHDFLYKMDAPFCEQPLSYTSRTWFCDGNDSPVADLVYPVDASDNKLASALDKLQQAIDAIENPNSDDLYELVDVESLARYYWIQEATMNFDAWQRSVYMYYSSTDGKMHLGPVWDMDITLGSPYEKAGMMFDTPQGFRIRNAGWYSALFEREDFRQTVVDVYYNGGVRQALFAAVLDFDNNKAMLGDDAYLNFNMFGYANQGTTIMYGNSYDEYCNNMIDFYTRRIMWIDEEMQNFK